jgi:hypothetical protein
MGNSLLSTGHPVQARAHFDKAVSLYEPVEHRPLPPRFGGVEVRVDNVAPSVSGDVDPWLS